ncbi:hypothetical protein COCC4DRAFT_31925 [Bipolaris maydis ATCC 48331]|uniref:Uncharacterized protein n=2 Tax=Cochliobolus heterostrophus TaxID=5016 RepID=M2ULX5_COCH5|nr:uncharacterized protein COCC4DRAFT_31925 [Bipolaris maydis ATCC 48331]EMD88927.1 hypothetical protein COCHEDRAFT_1023103 [Bipolaris maydis C5]ENI05357.1 hypothetical protein COCC4DRAFT_31925 [Bipolaris maydis ATCC 48331]
MGNSADDPLIVHDTALGRSTLGHTNCRPSTGSAVSEQSGIGSFSSSYACCSLACSLSRFVQGCSSALTCHCRPSIRRNQGSGNACPSWVVTFCYMVVRSTWNSGKIRGSGDDAYVSESGRPVDGLHTR